LHLDPDTSIVYLTARTGRSRLAARTELHYARIRTDNSISALAPAWSLQTKTFGGNDPIQSSLSSSSLIDALSRHRATLPVGPSASAFVDQVAFYSGVFDTLSTRLRLQSATADAQSGFGGFSAFIGYPTVTDTDRPTFGWVLRSLAGLVDCVNHIGAEHSSCAAFRLLDCTTNAFGLHETFVYAHASFAADVYFRFYLRSAGAVESSTLRDTVYHIPPEASTWRTLLDESFPQLELCRRNVLHDPISLYRSHGFGGSETQGPRPSGCEHRWQSGIAGGIVGHRYGLNQSLPAANKLTDLDRLVGVETTRINDEFDRRCRQVLDNAVAMLAVSVCAFVLSVAYALLIIIIGPVRSSTAWLTTSCTGCRVSESDVQQSWEDKNIHDSDNLKNSYSIATSQCVTTSPNTDMSSVETCLQCTDV